MFREAFGDFSVICQHVEELSWSTNKQLSKKFSKSKGGNRGKIRSGGFKASGIRIGEV